jgi:hypothetical protein
LQLLEGWERPGQACSVYKDMAAIEQAQGRLDRALEHLSKVRDILDLNTGTKQQHITVKVIQLQCGRVGRHQYTLAKTVLLY